MSQIFEALRRVEALHVRRNLRSDVEMAALERRESERQAVAARIRVYGYGQGLSPFFEENSILNASETGALLLMRAPVVAGQKLLLINEAAEQVQECRVVRTSCRESKELEVAVEFPNPQPQFWSRLDERDDQLGPEKRKRPRVTLPRGMDVTWRGRGESVLSKVQTISSGGLSIAAPEPPVVGELVHVSFEVPAGEVSARTVVRHSREGQGMGIEFLAMSDEARVRLDQLLHKLLS